MATAPGLVLPDPKRVQRWARRITLVLAFVGMAYLWARFSLTKAPLNVVVWPYRGAPLIVDEWPAWGRALEPGDLIYYRFAGEPEPRPVVVAGLAGQAVRVDADGALQAGERAWPHGPGPRLQDLAAVPGDHLLVLNHDADAPFPDSRSLGPVPAAGVEGRVIWYWPGEPPKKR